MFVFLCATKGDHCLLHPDRKGNREQCGANKGSKRLVLEEMKTGWKTLSISHSGKLKMEENHLLIGTTLSLFSSVPADVAALLYEYNLHWHLLAIKPTCGCLFLVSTWVTPEKVSSAFFPELHFGFSWPFIVPCWGCSRQPRLECALILGKCPTG